MPLEIEIHCIPLPDNFAENMKYCKWPASARLPPAEKPPAGPDSLPRCSIPPLLVIYVARCRYCLFTRAYPAARQYLRCRPAKGRFAPLTDDNPCQVGFVKA